MKVRLLKPHKIGLLEKPAGKVLEVTPKFGQQLIDDQVAELYVEKRTKALQPKKQEKTAPKDK